jgi:hypothetical protein
MPPAPLGGRLREADTWPCLVVSPLFVAWRQKTPRDLSDLGPAEGASHECAETRAFRAGGARSRGQISPRDSTRPRPFSAVGRPKKTAKALGTHYVTPTPQSQLIPYSARG